MITFDCPRCGEKVRVAENLAGTRTLCPECGHTILVPEPEGSVTERPPRLVEPDSPAERPARKKGSRRWGLILGIAALLLLLIGGGVLVAWKFLMPSGLTDELTYVPDNFDYIASVNVRTVLTSDLFQTLKKDIDEGFPDFDNEMKRVEKEFGIGVADIDRATVAGLYPRPHDRSEPEWVVVLKTRSAFELRDLFKGERFQNYEDNKVGSQTVRVFERGRLAVCVADKKTILLSSRPDALQRVLRREKKAEIAPGMQEAMKKADFTQAATFVMNSRDFRKDWLRDEDFRRDIARSFQGMIDAEGLFELMDTAIVQLRLGSKVELDAQLLGKDTKVSFSASIKTQTLLALWKGQKPDPTGAPFRFGGGGTTKKAGGFGSTGKAEWPRDTFKETWPPPGSTKPAFSTGKSTFK